MLIKLERPKARPSAFFLIQGCMIVQWKENKCSKLKYSLVFNTSNPIRYSNQTYVSQDGRLQRFFCPTLIWI